MTDRAQLPFSGEYKLVHDFSLTYKHFAPTVQEKSLWGLLSETSADQRIIISFLCLVLVLVLHLKCCPFTNTCSIGINTSNSQDEHSL